MAALTVASVATPYHIQQGFEPPYARVSVGCVNVSGIGTDISTLVAAVTGSQIIVLGGFIETDGGAAENMVFSSDAGTIQTTVMAAAAGVYSLHAMRGNMTVVSQALKVKKSGAAATVFGRVWYAVVSGKINYVGAPIE